MFAKKFAVSLVGASAFVLAALVAFTLIGNSLPDSNSENYANLFFDTEIEKSESKMLAVSNDDPPDAIVEFASSFNLVRAWSIVAHYKRHFLKNNFIVFQRRSRAPPHQS